MRSGYLPPFLVAVLCMLAWLDLPDHPGNAQQASAPRAVYAALVPSIDTSYVDWRSAVYEPTEGLAWSFVRRGSPDGLPVGYDTLSGTPWPHISQFPADLRARLASFEERQPHNETDFPGNVLLVDPDSIERAHPDLIVTVRRFSRVVVSEDGRDALVYREILCGPLCGSGALLWLSQRQGRWTIRLELDHWIS